MWTIALALLVPSILIFGDNSEIPWLFLLAGFLVPWSSSASCRSGEGHAKARLSKQVLDIRVAPEAAASLSSSGIVARELLLKNMLFGLPSIFLLGVPALVNYLWPLWDRRSRTLKDHLSATRVLTDLPT